MTPDVRFSNERAAARGYLQSLRLSAQADARDHSVSTEAAAPASSPEAAEDDDFRPR